MARLSLRKARIAPSLEPLEDRRMLSLAGQPTWQSGAAFGWSDHADLAPATFGPMSAAGDPARTTPDQTAQAAMSTSSQQPANAGSSGSGASYPEVSRPGTDSAPYSSPAFSSWTQSEQASDHAVPSSGSAPYTWTQSEQKSDDSFPTSDPTPFSSTSSTQAGQAFGYDSTGFTVSPVSFAAQNPWTQSDQATVPSYSAFAQRDESTSAAFASPQSQAAAAASASEFQAAAAVARSQSAATPNVVMNQAVPFVASPHATPSVSSIRGAGVSPGNRGESDSDDLSAVASPESAGETPLTTTGSYSAGAGDTGVAPSRGAAPLGASNGPGSPATLVRPTPDPAPARGPAEGRPIAEVPGEPGAAEAQGGASDIAQVPAGETTEPLDPRLADLILDLIPSGRPTLDAIMDRLFDPLDVLSVSMTGWDTSIILLASSLTVAGAALTLEISLRRRRGRDERNEDLDDFPSLPGLGTGNL